jgi:phytoene dehydrogenase-like protein
MADYDAIIVGSGHNGLAASLVLSRAGWKVLVVEGSDVPGGASKSRELTLPGYIHDVHAANIGFFLGSAIFNEFKGELFANGFGISAGDQPYASAFPDGDAVCGYMDPQKMVNELARHNPADAEAWTKMLEEFGRYVGDLLTIYNLPITSLAMVRHAYKLYRKYGKEEFWDLLQILLKSSKNFVDGRFQSEKVKALFTPWGMHLDNGPDVAGGAAFPYLEVPLDYQNGLAFSTGGVGKLMEAMIAILKSKSGEVLLGTPVSSIKVEQGRAVGVVLADGRAFSAGKAVIANVTPPKLFGTLVDEKDVPAGFMKKVKGYRYSAATMMVHLALDGPVPWAAGEHLNKCSYVHIGPYTEDICRAYYESLLGYLPKSPLLVCGQQSRLDPTRAPEGKETLWVQVRAVPPVPKGDAAGELTATDWEALREPYTERVLDKIESMAPGFKSRILAKTVLTPPDMEKDNPCLVGGDSISGSAHIDQNFMFRPFSGWARWKTPVNGLYMIGQSTWPGPGLSAASGYMAAKAILK